MSDAVAAARRHVREQGSAILAEFAELSAIPNVPSDRQGLADTSAWIIAALGRRGIEARAVGLDGAPPVVIARIPGLPDGPVIGVYAHYDGQPVDPDAWSSPPFEPTLRTGRVDRGGVVIDVPGDGEPVDPEWRLYGRGTADDRAPIVALLAALDALAGSAPGANVVVLFEGEEEIGSPHLAAYLQLLQAELSADVWVICDGPVHQSGALQVALGVRGFAEVEIEVFGPPADLHSGHYGDWAPNPAHQLASLLASMRDDEGRPTIEGYAADAAAVDEATARAAEQAPDPGDLGFAAVDGRGYATGLLAPLLNIRGLRSGDVGEASRNVVPSSAVASIDLRLVAGQDPSAAIESVRRHVERQGFHLVDGEPTGDERRSHRRLARVSGTPGYPGIRTSVDDPAARLVIDAVRRTGVNPLIIPSFGGSVPIDAFTTVLGSPVAILPIANHDNNQHAADENLRVGNLLQGVEIMAALLSP